MPEPILKESVAQKVEKHCERLHNDLGNPEPPICLDAIRELLRLDKTFYSLEDPSFLDQVFHKLSIAGQQVISQPTRLLAVWQRWDIKALWIPDTRHILLDNSIVELKKRWAETHEIGHSILPWHKAYLLGDPESSLSVSCRVKIEAEANYAHMRNGKYLMIPLTLRIRFQLMGVRFVAFEGCAVPLNINGTFT